MTEIEKEITNESEIDLKDISIAIHQDTSRNDNDWMNQQRFHTDKILYEPPKTRQDIEEH